MVESTDVAMANCLRLAPTSTIPKDTMTEGVNLPCLLFMVCFSQILIYVSPKKSLNNFQVLSAMVFSSIILIFLGIGQSSGGDLGTASVLVLR